MPCNRPHWLVGCALAATVLLGACTKRIALRPEWRVASAQELVTRMRAAAPALASYSAEARLTYFGPGGRLKGTASLAVQRPASLRYELQGPHGGVLEGFATNGAEISLVDFKQNRFVYGPATVTNFDALFSWAPLGLDGQQWVSLLFGEVVPAGLVALDYDDRLGRFVLRAEIRGLTQRLEVDPAACRVVRAQLIDGEELVSDVEVLERDGRGLPSELHLKVPRADVDVQVRMRDVVYDPELDADVFVLTPPRGAETIHLSAPPP